MNTLRAEGNSALSLFSVLTDMFGSHLLPTPHLKCLNTIMSVIIQEVKISSGHSFECFIKSICQFTGWSELEDSLGEDRLYCNKHQSCGVIGQSIQRQNSINPHNDHSKPLLQLSLHDSDLKLMCKNYISFLIQFTG